MSRTAGRLGWVLVWAVVFCDIGTSVYYVPGILHATSGPLAGYFVAATAVIFVLLAFKQVEATRRFPAGGGVVSLVEGAFGPWWGCLAGQFILVDFFLTAAISATSGVHHLGALLPLGGGLLVPSVVACLVLLGLINLVGMKESARVSLALAVAALGVELVVVGAALVDPVGTSGIPADLEALRQLPPTALLVGYTGAWLAFAGLESFAQIAPALRDLGATPRRGMMAVVVSVLLTAPALVFLSTRAPLAPPERLVSALAEAAGGPALAIAALLTGGALLLFGANTAFVGNYHVQVALTRGGFLPEALGALSARFQTPSRAILLCTLVPVGLVVGTGADLHRLADLYAFGLLGAFALGSVALDVLRWREGDRGVRFLVGVFTSAAVVLAFGAHTGGSPRATAFGGGLALVGMSIAVATRSGWVERALSRVPGLHPPALVGVTDVDIVPIAAVRDRVSETGPPGVLVASRGASRKLFSEAVDRARARGLTTIYLLYVDEVPGLLYPQLAAPTEEGLTVLQAGAAVIRSLGMEPIPVWALSHSAAATVAEAAEVCRCDTVVVGATARTFLWQTLRGRFIQDLLKQLPPEIRLIVVG